MKHTVISDFVLPSYDIILNAGSTFIENVEFTEGDEIEVETQHGSLGTIVNVSHRDRYVKLSFWSDDVPHWYVTVKNNTKTL
jgi:hypothetical protein